MPSNIQARFLRQVKPAFICALAGLVLLGCADKKRENILSKIPSRYQSEPLKKVPDFLKDTILQRCDLTNPTPFHVSGFGLVANLHGTGDSFAGTAVREHIIKEMINHGFGSRADGLERLQPEQVLSRPEFAIVRVDALIPPGARKLQKFDVYVSALDGNNTTSLSHGDLYRTDLKVNGANLQAPGYAVDVWAMGEGAIFVNPAYALDDSIAQPDIRTSLRRGTVLYGGTVLLDRPLNMRLRQPQLSVAREIQFRINQAFQDTSVASAKDDAMISLYVPQKYGTDWDHFVQVAMHLFLVSSPDFTAAKAKQLAEEAVKPDAPLSDISYCWEAMGIPALPFMAPLMTNDKPEVAYAAARAAAFLGDLSAQTALMEMARSRAHPFRVPAVETLAALPSSPGINHLLRSLLDSDLAGVRIEAYRALAEHGDSAVTTRAVRPTTDGRPSFLLDIVRADGPPLVYASRTGIPRIAVIGNNLQVNLPAMFMANSNQLMISSDKDRQLLNIFYRGKDIGKPVTVVSSPDLAELIGRLGGAGATGEARLRFSYCDIVAIVQSLSDPKRPGISGLDGRSRTPVGFVLQDAPRVEQLIEEAPIIPDQPPAPPPQASAGSRMNP